MGKVLNRYTVGKHFEIAITDDTLTVTRCQARLAPLLFQDEHRAEAEATRPAVVAPAPRSARATAKDRTKRTGDGHTVQSFRDLLRDLATVARNRIQPKAPQAPAFDVMTTPTALQTRAFRLLNVAQSSCSQYWAPQNHGIRCVFGEIRVDLKGKFGLSR